MFQIMEDHAVHTPGAVIKVIGVGGGGGNALEYMIEESVAGVEFIAVNTDYQALQKSNAQTKLQIGCGKGLGAGADPEVGRQAAIDSREEIDELLDGTDMLFIAVGMGGGTGTGAAPVIAEQAKERGILTVGVITRPWYFEGRTRAENATIGIRELSKHVDSLITVPNDRLGKAMGKKVTFMDAFKAANTVLHSAVQGITEVITRPGLVNLDFADVRSVMRERGTAMMGIGRGSGDNRCEDALENAIRSELLEDIELRGARGLLANITAGYDFDMEEFEAIGNQIHEIAADNANVFVGVSLDPDMNDEIRITLVATGLNSKVDIEAVPAPAAKKVESTISAPVQPLLNTNGAVAMQPLHEAERTPVSRQPAQGTRVAEDQLLNIPAFLRKQAD